MTNVKEVRNMRKEKKKTGFENEFKKWVGEDGQGCGCGKCLIEMANAFYLLGWKESSENKEKIK